MGNNIVYKVIVYVLVIFSICVVLFEIFWFTRSMPGLGMTKNKVAFNKHWSLTHFERLEYLTSQCESYSNQSYGNKNILDDVQVLDHILVDEKHKLLYCYVPKVACTNWKRVFLILVGKSNSTDALSIPADVAHKMIMNYKLSNYSKENVTNFLNTFTKFLFVRHPFERLVSAFHNKLEQRYSSSKYFQSRFGKHIIKSFRNKPTNHSLSHGDDVTFNEFAEFLIKSGDMNEHWRPIDDLCRPCNINYDFIGKHETLFEDAVLLLREVGVNVAFPAPPVSDTPQRVVQHFLTLSHTTIAQLYKLFLMDFKLFNYDLKSVSDSVTYVYVSENSSHFR